VRPDVQAATSLLVGIVTLRLALSGLYLNFVRPAMRPWLIAAGAALVVFGATAFLRAIRPHRSHSDDDGHAHAEHGHHHVPRAAWLLLLPALLLFIVPPKPLGSFAAGRQSNIRVDAPSNYPALESPRAGAVDMKVFDFVDRALYDERRSLSGVTVRLVGFVTPSGLSTDPRFSLSRFVITCCAADARVVQVDAYGAQAPPRDSWVEIVGTWHRPGKGFDPLVDTPGIAVKTMTSIPQPEVPYEQ
jgi:uncharacterized repeat protein (TIGR03943 family)